MEAVSPSPRAISSPADDGGSLRHRRVAKPSAEEPDAEEPARPDLWGARVSNDPGLPDRTAAYMSPEQAKGKAVDKRADVWAFGCVLYEMLTGRRAFAGESVSETMAAVLTAVVDLDVLPTDVPRAVRRLVRRCLEREPKKRLREIADGLLDLGEELDRRSDEPAASHTAPTETHARPWADLALKLCDTWRHDDIAFDLPLVLARADRRDEALAQLEENLTGFPDDTRMLHVAGATFQHLGNTERAEECYRDALVWQVRTSSSVTRSETPLNSSWLAQAARMQSKSWPTPNPCRPGRQDRRFEQTVRRSPRNLCLFSRLGADTVRSPPMGTNGPSTCPCGRVLGGNQRAHLRAERRVARHRP